MTRPAVLLLLAAATACTATPAPPIVIPATRSPTAEVTVAGCVVGAGGKADRRCDPGVLNPAVTQATIGGTICVPGWSDSVRPPTSYTTPLKRLDMARYGLTGPVTAYRYDHLIAQSLGGHLTDPGNLWPQPVADSYRKDRHTAGLRSRVCAGVLPLADAQRETLAAWTHRRAR